MKPDQAETPGIGRVQSGGLGDRLMQEDRLRAELSCEIFPRCRRISELNLEIHKPELVERVHAQIQSGHFHDVDELIEKALDALDERTPGAPATETGAVVLAALQASPYPDIDLTPPRIRLTSVRDVAL